jgi:hypothetical protein
MKKGSLMMKMKTLTRTRTSLLGLAILWAILSGGCAIFTPGTATTATTTTSSTSGSTVVLDASLFGQWTTEPTLVRVVLNEKGEPTETIPVGQWIAFLADGTYYRVSRHITVAIGGVGVEEGRYEAVNGSILLFERKSSFYPDQGSPQKPSYRQPEENENLKYEIQQASSGRELILRSGEDDQGIRYSFCPD